jgi:hypothetical protein
VLLKEFLNRTEVNSQNLSLSLYQVDKYYKKEILQGLCGELQDKFTLALEEVEFPEGTVPLDTPFMNLKRMTNPFPNVGKRDTLPTE